MSPLPDTPCQRCGGPHGDHWAAPSPLWNYVMRGNDIDGEWQYSEIICPHCFIELAEKLLGRPVSWRLCIAPSEGVDELLTITPTGRVWNPQAWLWEEPHA